MLVCSLVITYIGQYGKEMMGGGGGGVGAWLKLTVHILEQQLSVCKIKGHSSV